MVEPAPHSACWTGLTCGLAYFGIIGLISCNGLHFFFQKKEKNHVMWAGSTNGLFGCIVMGFHLFFLC